MIVQLQYFSLTVKDNILIKTLHIEDTMQPLENARSTRMQEGWSRA